MRQRKATRVRDENLKQMMATILSSPEKNLRVRAERENRRGNGMHLVGVYDTMGFDVSRGQEIQPISSPRFSLLPAP